MDKSELLGELATALSKAQAEMLPAKINSINPFLKNKYADLGAVIDAAKEPLARNGLSYSQHPSCEGDCVSVTTILMHSSGQWISSSLSLDLSNEKGLSRAQSMGVVVTYLRRYTLSSILGIYADEDVDGNDKSQGKPHTDTAKPPMPRPEPSPVAPPAATWTSTKITLETAMSEKNSEGSTYWSLPTDQLVHRFNTIKTAIEKNGMTPEKHTEMQIKLDVIQAILDYRK